MKLETNEVLRSTSFKPHEITKTNHYSSIMSQSSLLDFLVSFFGVLLSSCSYFTADWCTPGGSPARLFAANRGCQKLLSIIC